MLKDYASYFVSYLLGNLKSLETIERIVLFGSVSRNQEDSESDVDIFIEVTRKSLKFDGEIKQLEKSFYQSREAALFRSKGIENRFSVKIGALSEWKDLYMSAASTGIVLYGPYEAKQLPSGVKHYVIVYWDKIGKNRGAFLNKLYGFNANKKYYQGVLKRFEGRKIGKSCVMLPVQYKKEIFKLIRRHTVKAHVLEVFS